MSRLLADTGQTDVILRGSAIARTSFGAFGFSTASTCSLLVSRAKIRREWLYARFSSQVQQMLQSFALHLATTSLFFMFIVWIMSPRRSHASSAESRKNFPFVMEEWEGGRCGGEGGEMKVGS